jgi:hypothetical protein
VSFMAKRAELAAALSTVTDVRGYDKRPTVPTIGDAWPLFAGAGNRVADTFQGTWRVIVYCGGDEYTATEWMDAHLDELVEVLDPIAYVDTAEPALTTLNKSDAFVIEITARSE